MQKNHFFLLKKLKNTESAQLWHFNNIQFDTRSWISPRDMVFMVSVVVTDPWDL